MEEKQELRARMRELRREHVAAIPDTMRALLFLRPPSALVPVAPEGSVVGLYVSRPNEAPASGYARWFFENGRRIALPWFADRDSAMRFREWRDPFDNSDLVAGPHGLQPPEDSPEVEPCAVFVPLLAFTANGVRLGQGGGHYDRYLADHSGVVPLGLAWDVQKLDHLPCEAHDQPLRAIVTPTRIWGDPA